jgi:hypothetical protein
LNKITDLKSAPKGRVQKIQHCKGRVKRKKITGGKTKLAHITGGINLFTLFFYNQILYDVSAQGRCVGVLF